MSSGASSARAAADATASSAEPGCSMTACIQRWTWPSGRSGGGGFNGLLLADLLFPKRARLEGLGVDDVEGGDVGVPLEQRRDVAGPRHRVAVEIPDRVDHVVV